MEHIRSFLNDLGFVEEDRNTEKSSSSRSLGEKSLDIEENGGEYEVKEISKANSFRQTSSNFPSHDNIEEGEPIASTKSRSFSRFRLRSQSNNIEEEKIAECKSDVLDDAPANLFGYACGVGFCTSMEGCTSATGSMIDQADSILEPPVVDTKQSEDPDRLNSAPKTHINRWGHGKLWTMVALLFAWTGCICAVFTRQSTHYVNLRNPLIITEQYEPIHALGLIRVQLCYNESIPDNLTGCKIIRFSREEVDDIKFNLSRSLFALGSFLGMALSVVLSTSVIWESINLRPVAAGFLLSYLLQSFSMIFFDTDLCHEYRCQMASGGYLSITSCFCWIATLMAVAKMDVFKVQSIRARERAALRAERRAERQEQKRMAKRPRIAVQNEKDLKAVSVDTLDIEATVHFIEEVEAPKKKSKLIAL